MNRTGFKSFQNGEQGNMSILLCGFNAAVVMSGESRALFLQHFLLHFGILQVDVSVRILSRDLVAN